MKITKIEAFPLSHRLHAQGGQRADRARASSRRHRQAHRRQRPGRLGRGLHELRDRSASRRRSRPRRRSWSAAIPGTARRSRATSSSAAAGSSSAMTGNFAFAGIDMAMWDLMRQGGRPADLPPVRRRAARAWCEYFYYLHWGTPEDVAAQCDDGVRARLSTPTTSRSASTRRARRRMLEAIRERIGNERQDPHRRQPGLDRAAGRHDRSSAGTRCSTSTSSKARCRSSRSS